MEEASVILRKGECYIGGMLFVEALCVCVCVLEYNLIAY